MFFVLMKKLDKCDKTYFFVLICNVWQFFSTVQIGFLSQLNDCDAIIKARQNHLRPYCNRIIAIIGRCNTVHLLGKTFAI